LTPPGGPAHQNSGPNLSASPPHQGVIDDPTNREERDRLRGELEAWMKRTGDPLLEPFQRRDDRAVGEAFVRKTEQGSAEQGKRRAGRRQGRGAPDTDADE
jgi:hypothetical protein